MGNEFSDRDSPFEPKPGFDLVKYGNVFTFNFNQEFAQRLRNILADFHKNHTLQGQILRLFKRLQNLIEPLDEQRTNDDVAEFLCERFQHVYIIVGERDFAMNLNQVLTQFLVQKRVSPALFSFARQLEGALFPKRFEETRYADDF